MHASGIEANFDGLIGASHNYGGLSSGNLASDANRNAISAPRAAALEGLAKMRRLMEWGLVQGILPPQQRPLIAPLRALGFSGKGAGSDRDIWEGAFRSDPRLARQFISASPMWAANAATVSASADAEDKRVHFTPANLVSMCHRAVEAPGTARALARLFPDPERFAHHAPLPAHAAFGDEGAANHMRMSAGHGMPGVEIHVYGREAFDGYAGTFPARQTLEASRSIARLHGIAPGSCVFVRQSARAIAAGAFHNDVVAVAHLDTLFFHEWAFEDKPAALDAIRRAADGLFEPRFVEIRAAEVPIGDAISSYLFNSQLLRRPGANHLTLLLPMESAENSRVKAALDRVSSEGGPIGEAVFVDVRQSMRNGGGPACLRLRVPLTASEAAALHPGAVLTPALATRLEEWVRRHYREALAPDDLGDPALVDEIRAGLDVLTQILDLGSDFYAFQRAGGD